MPKVPVAGRSYIEIDDADGVPRNLSPYVEEVEPLGPQVTVLDVTGLNDTSRKVIAGLEPVQQFTLRGLYDDTPVTGPDAVLSAIVGKVVTVAYGPAGNGAGQRKVTGAVPLCQLPGRRKAGRRETGGDGAVCGPLPAVRPGNLDRVGLETGSKFHLP